MIWTETYTIIAATISIIASLGTFMFYMFNKLDGDIKYIGSRLDATCARMDAKMDAQTSRTDQLYQMFVDLLKEQRKG